MSQSFSIKSKDGRREVSAYLSHVGLTVRGWQMTFTKRTRMRSESRDGWERTKTLALRRAKEFVRQ